MFWTGSDNDPLKQVRNPRKQRLATEFWCEMCFGNSYLFNALVYHVSGICKKLKSSKILVREKVGLRSTKMARSTVTPPTTSHSPFVTRNPEYQNMPLKGSEYKGPHLPMDAKGFSNSTVECRIIISLAPGTERIPWKTESRLLLRVSSAWRSES